MARIVFALMVIAIVFQLSTAFPHNTGSLCGRNEHFTNCGSSCEPSCDKPGNRICQYICRVNVCECNDNFFRDRYGRCVLLSQCR